MYLMYLVLHLPFFCYKDSDFQFLAGWAIIAGVYSNGTFPVIRSCMHAPNTCELILVERTCRKLLRKKRKMILRNSFQLFPG